MSPCPKCGQVHEPPPRCQAHSRGGRQCRANRMAGATVCNKHGGSAPQVRQAAAARVAREKAERELDRTLGDLGESIDTSDGEALVELRNRYRGIVSALWQLCQGLHLVPAGAGPGWGMGADGIWGPTFHQTGTETGEAKPHVLMVMLGEWSDRLAKVDEVCVKLGLRERQIMAQEAHYRAIWEVLDRGLLAACQEVGMPELYGRIRSHVGVEAQRVIAQPPSSIEAGVVP